MKRKRIHMLAVAAAAVSLRTTMRVLAAAAERRPRMPTRAAAAESTKTATRAVAAVANRCSDEKICYTRGEAAAISVLHR